MRFVPILIALTLMVFLPSVLYTRHVLKQKNGVTGGIIAAYAIPTLFILTFILIQYTTRIGILDVKVMEWMLWASILLILPSNIYALFYIIDKIQTFFSKKSCRTLHYIGAIIASFVIIGMIIGAATRHKIKVREVMITSKNLPTKFDGIRIAHITDLHLGNLTPRDRYLKRIINRINAQQPDLLVFTGDMMNLTAAEAKGLDSLFAAVDAPLGRYAVMGNHDYGDYSRWPSDSAKQANIQATYRAYQTLGFQLLNDSALHLHLGEDSIGIIGCENWGAPPFPRYGDLSRATNNYQPASFNILLTHDATHWAEEVIVDTNFHYINLTLSGHTHATQLGFDISEKCKWSPSQYIYTYWDGLYKQKDQYLFISRGLGYTAIPFRLGMPAEISIITLKQE